MYMYAFMQHQCVYIGLNPDRVVTIAYKISQTETVIKWCSSQACFHILFVRPAVCRESVDKQMPLVNFCIEGQWVVLDMESCKQVSHMGE